MLLEINKITKSYVDDVNIIKDLSFSVSKGTRLCLFGTNGIGKSTILKIIAGVDKQTSGEISSQFKNISYLPQGESLIPWLTIKQNLVLGQHLTNNPPTNSNSSNNNRLRENENSALSLLRSFNLPLNIDSYPSQLSGGMRRIVEIARTLAISPDLIIMDEPFSGIDINIKSNIIKNINAYLKKNNVSLIFTTHLIDEVLLLSDKIILFKERPIKDFKEFATKNTTFNELLYELSYSHSKQIQMFAN